MKNRVCKFLLSALVFQTVLPLLLALPGAGLCDAARVHAKGMHAYEREHEHVHHSDHSSDQLIVCLCSLKQVMNLADLDAVDAAVQPSFDVAGRCVPLSHAGSLCAIPFSDWQPRAPPILPTA